MINKQHKTTMTAKVNSMYICKCTKLLRQAHLLKISICLSECSGFTIKYTGFGWSTGLYPATPSVMETCLVTLNSLSTINDKYMPGQHTAVYPSLHLY